MYIDYRRVHGEVYVMNAECMEVLMLLYKAKKNEMLPYRMSTRPLPPLIGGQRDIVDLEMLAERSQWL